MTTDKTSLGDWAREKAELVVLGESMTIGLARTTVNPAILRKDIEAAIIEGMVAALDRASKPLGCLSCLSPDSLRLELGCVNPGCDDDSRYESGIDALKKELRGAL